MPFALPTLPEALYRLTRLWRLVGCAALLPLIIVALFGLVGLSGIGGSLVGLVFLAVIVSALFAAHAVVFPNAHEETLALSVIMTMFVLVSGLAGGSILAWLFFLGFTIWTLMWGQTKIIEWLSSTPEHQPKLTAHVTVPTDMESAREWFPLAPDRERGQYRCGPPDADGIFPVWFDAGVTDIFEGLSMPELPEFEGTEEIHDAVDPQPNDPAYEIRLALQDAGIDEGPLSFDPDAPSFWGVIEVDDPDHQQTRFLSKHLDGSWKTETVVNHWFKATKSGCRVTETDAPDSYPWGQTFAMRLQGFQMDGLVYLRDLLTKKDSLALRATHRWSLLMLTGKWFMQRRFDEAEV